MQPNTIMNGPAAPLRQLQPTGSSVDSLQRNHPSATQRLDAVPDGFICLDPASCLVARFNRVSELVGAIYGGAPGAVRARLLEHLLRPISPYALIGIPRTRGVFAQIRARNAEWQGFRVEPADITSVQVRDVVALIDWMQQLRPAAIPDLIALAQATAALADCQAVAALVALRDTQS